MTKLKDFKGVSIYITPAGEFYCDLYNNSEDFKKKTFSSFKLNSVENAIEEFKGADIEDGESYYDIHIQLHLYKINKIKVVKKIGNRKFFDDGTDTASPLRKKLYPENIKENQDFKKLHSLMTDVHSINQEIVALAEKRFALKLEADKCLAKLPKTNIS